jgi:hypothetical protein
VTSQATTIGCSLRFHGTDPGAPNGDVVGGIVDVDMRGTIAVGPATDIRALTAVIAENPEGQFGVHPDPVHRAMLHNAKL